MAAKDEELFPFDPESFIKGLLGMTKAMKKMSTESAKTANGLSSTAEQGFDNIAKGQKKALKQNDKMNKGMLKSLIVFELIKQAGGAAFRFIKGAVTEFMPEVGMAFGAARNIIMKNLFFPIRQAVLPLLNKFLKWVQNNRTMFVKWGVVIVNVFKFLVTAVKTFWTLVKSFFKGFSKVIGDTFGTMGKSFSEIMNLMLVKLTTIMILIEAVLGPVFKLIGKVLGGAVLLIKKFVDGFVKGFSSVFESTEKSLGVFQLLKDIWQELIDIVKELGIEMDGMGSVFRKLGEIIGTTVGEALRLLLGNINAVLTGFKNLIKFAKGDLSFGEIAGEFGSGVKNTGKRFFESGKNVLSSTGLIGNQQDDAFISKNGQVTPLNPNDNLIAFKGSTPGGGAGSNISIDMGGITVMVTEGDARRAGEEFADGATQSWRANLIEQMNVSGG